MPPNPSCTCIYNNTAAGPRSIHAAGKDCPIHGNNSAESAKEDEK